MKRQYTYREFLQLLPYCTEEHRRELIDQVRKARKPMFFAGIETPESLNLVTYGLLDDLANISNSNLADPIAYAIVRIMGCDESKVYESNVFDVFGMSEWITREVERINKLFATIAPKYSNEQIAAGVKRLDFGSFGVLDWYAKRQGISDQNEVRDVAWVRIFTCMKNDNEMAEYQKRLNEIYEHKQRHKRNGHT